MKQAAIILGLAIAFTACTSNAEKERQAMLQRQMDSVNTAQVKQRTEDSLKLVEAKRAEVRREENRRIEASSSSSNASNGEPTVAEKKKKGWSPTAQGAVIGAATGAVAGAIIDKKKGRGAIIGGVVGAGAGAVTGNAIKKKKERANQ